ncbi:DUF4307 domain-containing protein [Paractinoplanes ferrugineus]|uniref:DUF4307 domain-containing protein n=1 Tax=Paractinoplanes ferrugineus TaxID=113564 RepID=UPI001EF33ECF|nr:DUF4307 domain-containing protein [Actinoplanes ferrugineus]
MSETHTTNPVFPPGRYGRRRAGRRQLVLPIFVLILVVAASLLVSVKLYQRYGQTDYEAQIVGWQEPTATTMVVKFRVRVPAGGAAKCVLRARDYQGNQVGLETVVVRAAAGRSEIETETPVTTSEKASVGDVLRCQPAG